MSIITPSRVIVAASVLGFLSVALGAFAAHALKNKLDDYAQGIWQTATQYQIFHALAMLAVAVIMQQWQHPALRWSALSFLVGSLIFSGSLYLLAITQVRWLGAITPIGGTALMAGWLLLLIAALKEL